MKNYKNFAVVTPSYREDKNIAVLLERITKYLPGAKVFIVDDSDVNDNKKIAKTVAKYKNAKLISRFKKLGRGSAIITGFKEALRDKNIEYFFEMDSDLAHNPSEFERYILRQKEKNYDVVIGSRFLSGAKMLGINLKRRLLSIIVNRFLYFWLNVHISDFTGGFRLYSRRSIEYLTSIELKSHGFITLSEVIYRLRRKGLSIGEVPITINNIRMFGTSTVNSSELTNSLKFVLKMRIIDLFSIFSWKLMISIILVFLFAFTLRVSTLNQMGRTWDEAAYVEVGNQFIQLIEKGDIHNKLFIDWTDEPPLGRYIYGVFSNFDKHVDSAGNITYNYDYTYARLAAVILTSLAVVLVLLIGWEFISPFVGLVSGIILAMLPFFIGLSQIATMESGLFFFFTLAVYCYLKFLKKSTKLNLMVSGIAIGLAVLSKYTNILIVPVIIAFYYFYVAYSKSQFSKIDLFKKTVAIFGIGLSVFVLLWPMPWFDLSYVISKNFKWRIMGSLLPDIEIFYGRLMHLPVFYYFLFFLITTPLLILVFFFLGSKFISDYSTKTDITKRAKLMGILSEKWFLYSLIAWFCIPFIHSFYNFRHHGVRFIIEIYAPLSIIAALGFNYLADRLTKRTIVKILLFLPVLLYMFVVNFSVSPYYLDYYNEVVGGTKTVSDKKLFEIGWWGQGLGEAGFYLQNHAKKNSTIALFISPLHVFPPIKNQTIVLIDPNKGVYDPKIKYDYVVVNDFHVLREGFDDSGIRNDYKLMHQVTVDQAPLVNIYEKK